MTDLQRRTFDSVDLDLQAGRCLRVGMVHTESGEPERLLLVAAFRDGGADPHHRMELPPEVLPRLRRALEGLEAIR